MGWHQILIIPGNMKLPDDDFDDSNIYATDVVMLKVREKGAFNN